MKDTYKKIDVDKLGLVKIRHYAWLKSKLTEYVLTKLL